MTTVRDDGRTIEVVVGTPETEIDAFFEHCYRLDGKQSRVVHRRGSRAAANLAARAAIPQVGSP